MASGSDPPNSRVPPINEVARVESQPFGSTTRLTTLDSRGRVAALQRRGDLGECRSIPHHS